MDKEEDQCSVIESKSDGTSRPKINNSATEKHSSKIRRRNVIEKINSSSRKENDFNCNNKCSEFSLDTEKAWTHGIIPKLPEILNINSPGN